MLRSYRWLLGLLVLGPFAAGCGGPKLTEVEGTVTLNGKPLDNVQVEFLPDPAEGTSGPRSTGMTDKEGRFKLMSDNKKGGAVIGTHRVLVTDLKQWEGLRPGRQDADKPLKPSRLPEHYTDAINTPLKGVEVKPGGPPIKLELTNP